MRETLPAAAEALKAAGEPSRLRILKMLEGGELCVCHLVGILGSSQPTVSRHLAVLRRAGLVAERKEGRWSHYRLAPASPFLRRLLRTVRSFGDDDPVVRDDRRRAREIRERPARSSCGPGGRRGG